MKFSTKSQDTINKDAQVDSLEIEEDDIVIAGSDGLWDNVHASVLTFAVNKLVKDNGIYNADISSLENEMEKIAVSFARALETNPNVGLPKKEAKNSEFSPKSETKQSDSSIQLNDEQIHSWRVNGFVSKAIGRLRSMLCRRPSDDDLDENDDSISDIRKQEPASSPLVTEDNKSLDDQYQSLEEHYLRCTPEELVDSTDEATSFWHYISDCARKAIKGSFGFQQSQIKDFKRNHKPKTFSIAIKHLALKFTKLPSYLSRFAMMAKKNEENYGNKGKEDDITVVTGLVTEAKEPEDDQSSSRKKMLSALNEEHFKSDFKNAIQQFAGSDYARAKAMCFSDLSKRIIRRRLII